MSCLLKQLERYGICANTPEHAEFQLQRLYQPQPEPSVYQRQAAKIDKDDRAGLDIIGRVRDGPCSKSSAFWSCNRRNAIRHKEWNVQHEIDARLAECRESFAYWVDYIRAKGFPLELRQTQHEETLEEGLVSLLNEKIRVHDYSYSVASQSWQKSPTPYLRKGQKCS